MSNQLPTQQPPSPPSSHTHSRGSSLTMRVGTFKRYNNLSPRLANEIKQAVRVTQYTVALPQRERSKERISRLFTLPSRTSITFTPPFLPFVGRKFALCGFRVRLKWQIGKEETFNKFNSIFFRNWKTTSAILSSSEAKNLRWKLFLLVSSFRILN